MKGPALGEAATQLAWLCPCADSLLALARTPTPDTWTQVRLDPGCVLLLACQAHSTSFPRFPTLLAGPAALESALWHLRAGPEGLTGFVDWSEAAVRPVYHASLAYARLARHLAERTRRCDPDNAWVAGLLAPLGWLAVCAVHAEQAVACLDEPDWVRDPARTEHRLWGLDQGSIARRLARRWQLPRWLTAIIDYLGTPAEVARTCGADVDLLRVVQMAVRLAQQQGIGLRLPVGGTAEDTVAALALSDADQQAIQHETQALVAETIECSALERLPSYRAPDTVPLLPDLLALAVENRRLHGAPLLDDLASDVDRLHQALQTQCATESNRLQAQKLSALAEMAAGAGHEINNPLAVISGQAQYLLIHEADPTRQHALQTIINQAQRIHQILNDLMQFARPSRPQKQDLDAHHLAREVVAALSALAKERQVRLVGPETEFPVRLHGDVRQLRTALTCLLRNAIEASPPEGWASVRLDLAGTEKLLMIVEDSGSGPTGPQREHMFDPFYSGRSAGRGRGLGLPTAWRLAHEHGGDVFFDDQPGGPTRFVLSLPCASGQGSWGPAQESAAGNGTVAEETMPGLILSFPFTDESVRPGTAGAASLDQ